MVKLSENFTLNEFLKSETAERLEIDNRPSVKVIDNLKWLTLAIMQPVRTHFGSIVIITSGFRCAMLNKAVGGQPSSQHLMGQACDFIMPNVNPKIVFDYIKNNLDFDQLLFEYDKKGNRWIHVSHRHDGKNRRHAIFNYKSS